MLPLFIGLCSVPPLRGVEAAFASAAELQRSLLLTFDRASLHTLAGEREAWARVVRRVKDADGGNAYDLQFTGGGG